MALHSTHLNFGSVRLLSVQHLTGLPGASRRSLDRAPGQGSRHVEAGADIIGIGDPAASLVGPRIYRDFVWPYEKKLVDGLHSMDARVRLHICGNTRLLLEDMGRLGCEIVDIDSLVSLAEARQKMGPQQVLLGNIDPVRVLRDRTPESIAAAVAECHRQAGPAYILGAGCEVPRGTPRVNLLALAACARSFAPGLADAVTMSAHHQQHPACSPEPPGGA